MNCSMLLAALLLLFVAATYAQNLDCALIVPANALTAQGLATPYQLTAQDPSQGPCSMNNTNQQALVQGSILDTDTGAVYVYNPLVIDAGTQPAVNPVVPTLPHHFIVALWFGFNGDSLILLPAPNTNSVVQANCVYGVTTNNEFDPFGQFMYCNSPNFFQAAVNMINIGRLTVPQLGIGNDGYPCPTVRDFAIVDENPSDTVVTTYLLTSAGTVAQDTRANRARFPDAQVITNAGPGPDYPGVDALLVEALDTALNCTPWVAPNLADPGTFLGSCPLDELLAIYRQAQPAALIPAGDNDVVSFVTGLPSLAKMNAFRAGIGQPTINSLRQASTTLFCQAFGTIGPARFQSWEPFVANLTNPDPASSTTFYGYLVGRFIDTWGPDGLNCSGLLSLPPPLNATVDDQGLVTGGTVVYQTNLIPASAFQPGGEFHSAP